MGKQKNLADNGAQNQTAVILINGYFKHRFTFLYLYSNKIKMKRYKKILY